MSITTTSALHDLNEELRAELVKDDELVQAWNSLTEIQRNEWICWTTMAKQEATRARRVHRAIEELQQGKKTPCCWPGCPHRRPAAAKYFD